MLACFTFILQNFLDYFLISFLANFLMVLNGPSAYYVLVCR